MSSRFPTRSDANKPVQFHTKGLKLIMSDLNRGRVTLSKVRKQKALISGQ